ncbi:MAG: amino acid adenylation domain-containing protein [Calothrix sp. FI2-JRJ7]|nr:amino acid adenylation domain-containing protein [Calothrix sp. FI2-JRJ7]
MKDIEDFYPLSSMQQGILFHSLYAQGSGVYCELFSCSIQGELDIIAFKQAWQQLMRRHPILRTSFVWKGLKEPAQVVHKQVLLPWEQKDWRAISSSLQKDHIEAFLVAEQQRGFEISQVPLMRLTLIQLAENYYQFVWSHHHLLLDGWSSSLLANEVFNFYQAFIQGKDLDLKSPRPYRDYIAWLQKQNLSESETFWRQYLHSFTAATSLKLGDTPSHVPSQEKDYRQQHLKLSKSETAALQFFARQQQLTLNTLVQGAWAILLNRYNSENDVVFGCVVSGRGDLAGDESIIGVLINTLPMRVYVNSEEYLLPWLKKLQAQQNEIRYYQYCPLIEIQKWSNVPSGSPLFESILNFQNYPVNFSQEQQVGSLKLSDIRNYIYPHYPLTVSVQVDSELLLEIFYERHRFNPSTITRMLGHFRTLLLGMAANQQQHIKDLPLLTAQEHQLLVEWNNTSVDYSPNQCIHEIFEAHAEQTPDTVAVVFEDQHLTYGELNARANQLAHCLRSLGVKPEVLVGIYVERSLDMVVGLLAILKAGGAYVPLDPSYPKERLAYMLEDCQASVLLTQQYLVESLPTHKAKVVCIDSNWELIVNNKIQNPVCNITVDNLAYVIYTSGSTGKPKGAMNTHRAVSNRLQWMQDTYQLTPADSVLQKTPFSFDVSVWEFFWPLQTGARLVIAQPEGHRDTGYLVNLINKEQITTLHFVPSMLQVFLEAEGLENCQSLKRVIASGEALPAQLQQRFFNRLDAQLHNLYGPTEAAIDVTYWECQQQNSSQDGVSHQTVPIGRPIANIQIYLLDRYLNPVSVGVTGEVYIGGVGVSRGYLNRPDLTAEKFIPDPFSKQPGRLYKTGDKARYLANGEIEYLGRIDYQVKVRGFRIELGEVEAVLCQHPAVRETVVVVHSSEADSQRLVAYVVPHTEQTLTNTELRGFLELKLPNYMVPAAFVILDALPLTPNGKVDRRTLLVLDTIRPELDETFVAPQTTVEKQLVIIWGEVLGLEKIGINDNFFELGGDSILSLQVISKANQVGLHLTPKQLFQHQTIAQLAAVAATTRKIQAEQVAVTGLLELTPIQHWFFEQKQPEVHHWNQSVLLEGQNIDPIVLEKVVQSLQVHHDVLRLRFIQQEFSIEAVIVSPDNVVPLTCLDFSTLPKGEQAAAIEAVANKLQASLNLSEGPLFRVALFDLGNNQPSCLLWIIHHLVVDGVSWRILIEDFQAAYQQISQGKAIKLPPKTTSYKQWSNCLQEYAQSSALHSELNYWLTQYQYVQPIPIDFPGGDNTEATTSSVLVSLSAEETQVLLQQVPAAYRAQINDVLLTALIQAFNQWTGQSSLLINLEGHGREELFENVDLSRTVGWFTTIFPVHLSLENANNLEKALKSIKEQLRLIPNRGIGYGLLRYLSRHKEIAERLSSLPKAEVVFNYLGQFDNFLPELSQFKPIKGSIGSVHSPYGHKPYLLEVEVVAVNRQLQLNWIYSKDLYRQDTITGLAQNMLSALRYFIVGCQFGQDFSYIPADFPEAQLNQAELDKVFEELELD